MFIITENFHIVIQMKRTIRYELKLIDLIFSFRIIESFKLDNMPLIERLEMFFNPFFTHLKVIDFNFCFLFLSERTSRKLLVANLYICQCSYI